jgi:hypothetical protein
MLLCFDDEQRIVYVLGEIFGVTDRVDAELLEVSRDTFRQKLARARRDLYAFMRNKCGLVDSADPCRCANKTRGFIQRGYVNPDNLLFAKERFEHVRVVAPMAREALAAADVAYAEIYRGHPFHEGPDFIQSLRRVLTRPEFAEMFSAAADPAGGTRTRNQNKG